MAAAKHDITVGRGEDFGFTLTLTNDADPPTAIDLANDLFKAEVRRDAGKPLVAAFSCTISDASGGVVSVRLPQEETLKLDGNARYKWDLYRIVDGDVGDPAEGDTVRLLYGDLKVENNITDF